MSLIDEALKRAQAAQQDAGTPPAERPWTPAPLPDAGPGRRRRVVRALGVLAAVAVAAGAAVMLLRAPGPRPSPAPPPRPAAVAARATAPPARPTESEASTPRPDPAAGSTPRTRRAAAPPPAGSSDGGIPAAPEETSAGESEPRAAPPSHGGLVAGKTYVGAVTLSSGAKIELGGIVWSEDDPRALVNDRVVGVGAIVEGFTLTAIAEDRVVLEKDALKITLALK